MMGDRFVNAGRENRVPSKPATKESIGLGNVLNVEQIPTSEKGSAGGVATLDPVTGHIPLEQMNPVVITAVYQVDSEAEQLALNEVTQIGDFCIRTDESKTYIKLDTANGDMTDWRLALFPVSVVSVNGKTGIVNLTLADLGIGNIGADKQVLYNSGGLMTGNAGLTFDPATGLFVQGNVGIGVSAPTTRLMVVEAGITPDPWALLSVDRAIGIQGNGGAFFVGRDATNHVEFVMGCSSSGSVFVGSMTNHQLSLRTNNVEGLRINTDRSVSIATKLFLAADPSAALEAATKQYADKYAKGEWSGHIETAANKTYTLCLETNFAGTINALKAQSGSGTCTLQIYKNGVALGNSLAITEAGVKVSQATIGAFVSGDKIDLVITGNSSCEDLIFSVQYTIA